MSVEMNMVRGPRRDDHPLINPTFICIHLADNPRLPHKKEHSEGFKGSDGRQIPEHWNRACLMCAARKPEEMTVEMIRVVCEDCFQAAMVTGESV